MKKIIKKILLSFGLDIRKINPELKNRLTFDEIYKLKIKNNPIIFDIGANKGQSIKRFRKIFPNSVIYAFEPNIFEYEILKNKYKEDKKIILNNFAVGDKRETKSFYITAKSGSSSFNKVNFDTKWIEKRSKQFNTTKEGYIKSIENVKVIKLDDYCEENNIKNIDILKIDTQGYEDKVLAGCEDILQKNIITAVELELMFDNVYERYLTFSDVEKFLIPNNFRFSAISTANNNLFEGLVFFADLIYLNKSKIDLK